MSQLWTTGGPDRAPESLVFQKLRIQVNVTSVTSGREVCKMTSREHSYTETTNCGRVIKAPDLRVPNCQ